MTEPARVMAVGTVMVDVLAVGLPHIAEPGHVVYTPSEIESLIGGHPVDVAIDLVKLGFPSRSIGLVAAVGHGMYGAHVTEIIERHDVETFLQPVPSHDTGKNLVLEVEGEDRRFHLDPGANWYLDPDHVAGALERFGPHVLTLRPGYTGIDLHLEALLADLSGVLVMLDVMQPHPSRPVDLVVPVLPRVHIVHCNEKEAMAVTGAPNLESALASLLESGPRLVLLTSGASGARAITATSSVAQPGFQIDPVDATGCGDAFCAGVIEWLIEHTSPPTPSTLDELGPGDLAELLAHAQSVGAAAATRAGCVEGVSRRLVDQLRVTQLHRVVAATRNL
ncbi:MAG: PfkB family carbohydrate kinase [Acidimicrobiia bacterium]